MPFLQQKNILIVSPQSWGNMMLSKHHYAIELAKKGNKVYFLNPPNDPLPAEAVDVKPSGIHENLFFIENKLYFPYNLKFHALSLFHFLMRRQVKKIVKHIPGKIDIVWSFDIGFTYPLYFFPSTTVKIFHPVDEPSSPEAIKAATGAVIIFSVTSEILDKYAHLTVPRYFINHGLQDEFLQQPPVDINDTKKIHVGFSGNLLRNDLDRSTLLTIVKENPGAQFEFWGTYRAKDSNIGGSGDAAQVEFIEQLIQQSNVTLHGAVNSGQLAESLGKMDAFLICYDVEKDQSKGTNYHKIMEYISTGKVIVSNNVTTYHDKPDLVQMIPERDSNNGLPVLFKKVVENLSVYNAAELQEKRKQFARDNTYTKQVERIDERLEQLLQHN